MRILVLAPVLVLATGCDEWERIFTKMHVDGDDTDVAPALGCADIDGTFAAVALHFASEADPGISEDYGDYPDFTIVFDRRAETFEAMIVLDDQAFVTS